MEQHRSIIFVLIPSRQLAGIGRDGLVVAGHLVEAPEVDTHVHVEDFSALSCGVAVAAAASTVKDKFLGNDRGAEFYGISTLV